MVRLFGMTVSWVGGQRDTVTKPGRRTFSMDISDFYGPNAGYVLELYERYLADPGSVDEEWRATFDGWERDVPSPSLPAVGQNGPACGVCDVTKIVAGAR